MPWSTKRQKYEMSIIINALRTDDNKTKREKIFRTGGHIGGDLILTKYINGMSEYIDKDQ